MMLFIILFLCNSVAQSLMSTGAFEVEFNGKLVYSKLETGRMPNLNELFEGFAAAGLKEYELTGH